MLRKRYSSVQHATLLTKSGDHSSLILGLTELSGWLDREYRSEFQVEKLAIVS